MDNGTQMDPRNKTVVIREMDKDFGDKHTRCQVAECEKLDFKFMVTAMPDGTIVHSFDELLEAVTRIPDEEIEVMRFPPMAGG